jgi:hypothetical protein
MQTSADNSGANARTGDCGGESLGVGILRLFLLRRPGAMRLPRIATGENADWTRIDPNLTLTRRHRRGDGNIQSSADSGDRVQNSALPGTRGYGIASRMLASPQT